MSKDVAEVYSNGDKWYDLSAFLLHFLGYRESVYRKKAIDRLNLHEGDVVLEIACGTGLNFANTVKRVGERGKIVGIDMSDGMLRRAAERIERRKWKNIELIKCSAEDISLAIKVDAVLSTFAFSFFPEIEKVLNSVSRLLETGGRISIMDMRTPDGGFRAFNGLFYSLTKHYGLTKDFFVSKPWETVERIMNELFAHVQLSEYFFGFSYCIDGKNRK